MMDSTRAHTELDRARFERTWAALGARQAGAFETLAAHYADGGRHYHTAEHINACLGWLAQVSHLAQRPPELELALFF